MNQTPILLATSNPAKQETFRWLLEGLPLAPVTPGELGLDAVPDEVGESHGEIARLKAQQWSRSSSMLAVASDGGLVVPALGAAWQSLYTHRFAGEAATDAQRVRRLLELLESCRGQDRRASWIESLAIALRGRLMASWELTGATGVIAGNPPEVPEETRGFWTFSIWEFPELGKSYRQLTHAERESLDDHWVRLKGLVRRFFQGHFVPPLP